MSSSKDTFLDFYTLLERSGSHFIKENGERQKIHSLSSDFVVFLEKCRYIENKLSTEIDLLSFSGSTNFHTDNLFYPNQDSKVDASLYLHRHDYFELMFVLEGTVPVQIENRLYLYRINDICLINRSVRHIELFDSDCTVAFICLPIKLAMEITTKLTSDMHASLLSFFQENASTAMHEKNFLELRKNAQHHIKPYAPRETLLRMIEELKGQRPGYVSIVQGMLFRFFCYLTDEHDYKAYFIHIDFTLSDYIFGQIHSYMIQTAGMVNRKELEQALHYSADYLNKIVKQHSQMTLVEYGQAYRMKEAARLICTTDMPIEKISQQLGFESKAYFYRLFEKTYHMSPIVYRKSRKGSQQ